MLKNPRMASGYVQSSLQGRVDMEKEWIKLGNKLNTLGGPIKTIAKWKQAWRDLKNNVKKKAVQHNETVGNTRTSLPSSQQLSDVDNQVLAAIASVAVYGTDANPEEEFTDEMKPDIMTKTKSPSPDPLLAEPGPDEIGECELIPAEPNLLTVESDRLKAEPNGLLGEPRQTKSKKLGRFSVRQNNFNNRLLYIEEKKLRLKQEKNRLSEERNRIAEKKNVALNRIADVLEDIASKLD